MLTHTGAPVAQLRRLDKSSIALQPHGSSWSRLLGPFHLALVGSLVALGCDGGERDVEGDPIASASIVQALNGVVQFSDGSCNASRQATIRSAVAKAYEVIYSPYFGNCLDYHVLSGTNGNSPETIVKQLREPLPTEFRCKDFQGELLAWAPINISSESVVFDTTELDTDSISSITAILLHEIAHNKGYDHGGYASFNSEYPFTVTEQVRACAYSVIRNSFRTALPAPGGRLPIGNGRSVFQLARGALPAPTGGNGGSPKRDSCGTDEFAVGLVGRVSFGHWVDAIGLDCQSTSGTGAVGQTSIRGGSGGTSFNLMCPSGTLLVGIGGGSSNTIGYIHGYCLAASAVAASTWSTPVNTATAVGGTNYREAFQRMCPVGHAIKAMRVRSGSGVDSIAIECQLVGSAASPAITYLPLVGTTGATTMYFEKCPYGSIVVGLFGRVANEVNRVGGICDAVVDKGQWVKLASEYGHALPGHGGWGGSNWPPSNELCSPGQALVGLTFRSGSRVDKVQGQCADAAQWSDTTVPESLVAMSVVAGGGGSGGGETKSMCPRGFFVDGWNIWEGLNGSEVQVFGMQGECVRASD